VVEAVDEAPGLAGAQLGELAHERTAVRPGGLVCVRLDLPVRAGSAALSALEGDADQCAVAIEDVIERVWSPTSHTPGPFLRYVTFCTITADSTK
jgi:hypothetical protein